MSVLVDVRGLSCPVPVVRTKKALEAHPAEEIVVLVDGKVAKENVCRLAGSLGWSVDLSEDGGEYKLTMKKG